MLERRAKIVATLGPASSDSATIERMIAAGMNVARLNFSHGTLQGYVELIGRIRNAADNAKAPICILQDLQGPKIRVGDLTNPITLTHGDTITLTTNPLHTQGIPVDFPELPRFVRKGGRILLDDGALELEATAVKKDSVQATVVIGGLLKSNKGINLPGADIDLAAMTYGIKAIFRTERACHPPLPLKW